MNRPKKLPLLAAVVGTLLLFAASADAGGKSKMKQMFKMMPKPVVVAPTPVVVAPTPVVVAPTPFVVAPAPVVVAPAPVIVPPPHVHAWRVVHEQVWVPPVYTDQVVGYDFFGQPVVRRVMAQAGYYRAVSKQHCACGAMRTL